LFLAIAENSQVNDWFIQVKTVYQTASFNHFISVYRPFAAQPFGNTVDETVV
jgi:hypothetical protein